MKEEWKLPKKVLTIIGVAIAVVLLAIIFFSGKGRSESAPEPSPLPVSEETPELEMGWARFKDPHGRFTIDIPEIAETLTEKGDMAAVGYLPTCNPETGIVCAYFPKTMYPRTNFSGAGVSVNVGDSRVTRECLAAGPTEQQALIEDVIIGGVPFEVFLASDAAMSHQSTGANYRALFSGSCYEITVRINTTTFEVYEEGSIDRFTEDNRATVERILQKIVSSFRFSPLPQ